MAEHTVECVKSSRLNELLNVMNHGGGDDDLVAEIDLRIEGLELEIRRLRQLRALMVAPAPSEDEVVVRPYTRRAPASRNGTHRAPKQPRKKLSGLALTAHNNRVAIAKILAPNPKGMTHAQIAELIGKNPQGLARSLNHEAFARLSHQGVHSLYTLTDKGRELAKHG